MKLSAICALAMLAVASAQDARPEAARRMALKEQLMEHRKDMFANQEVSRLHRDGRWFLFWNASSDIEITFCRELSTPSRKTMFVEWKSSRK